MKRRVYHPSARRQRLVSEAMETAKQARESIDPALLERAREVIGAALEAREQAEEKIRPMHSERVPVDKRKNLSIVMKYLEMRPDNKALQKELSTFLAGQ